jgi:hypothetical protein
MRVNFIGLPHVTHGSSVLSKRLQLGGGGVIFMVAQFRKLRVWFDHLGRRARRRGGSVQEAKAGCSTGILMVQIVP